MKKYELVNHSSHLYQIKALKSFGDIDVGELGGWVEFEDNLSQEGDCWIDDRVNVYGNSRISDNVRVYVEEKNDYCDVDNSTLSGNLIIRNSRCIENVNLHGDFKLSFLYTDEPNHCEYYGPIVNGHTEILRYTQGKYCAEGCWEYTVNDFNSDDEQWDPIRRTFVNQHGLSVFEYYVNNNFTGDVLQKYLAFITLERMFYEEI